MLETCRFGRVEVRPAERQLLIDSEPTKLGARAFDVLLALIERRDRIVSKNELLDSVWPGLVVEENNLQVQVSSLRKALGPQSIATVPGRGYRFTAAIDGAPLDQPNAAGLASRAAFEPSDLPARPLTNLPAEMPRLYGRAEDLSAMRTLIESHNLVTVVGAGGIGKTALAQALAHQLRGSFDDGVWIVELAPLADASLVPTTVASTLHVALGGDASSEILAKAFCTSRMLIVLDNCEHLLHGVAELAAAINRACPTVRLLATSQEPLKVAHEHVYRLGALDLPAEGGVESARQAGAVALFEARACAADPRFVLNERNVAAVVDICRRLDGIALAIELAAARVRLLGVDGLRARLDERLRVLTGGARLALPRHQTLRAALDWSYGLLTPDEQSVFRRLGVFVGSFALESAQRVAADDRIDQWAVLDHLGALVDKSLVVAEAGEEPRYRILETGRAWAIEKLVEAGELPLARRAHARAVLALLERAEPESWSEPVITCLQRYLPDIDNVRAALDWAATSANEADFQIALTAAVPWLWRRLGQRAEGLRWCDSAVARISATTPPALEAELRRTWVAMSYPRMGAAERESCARAVALFRQLGDRMRTYLSLVFYAVLLARGGDFEASERISGEAAALKEADWPPGVKLWGIWSEAWIRSTQGRYQDALVLWKSYYELAASVGDKYLSNVALAYQKEMLDFLGRYSEAIAAGRDVLARIRRETFSTDVRMWVLGNLSRTLTVVGELDEAIELAREALPLIVQADMAVDFLDGYGLLALRRGRVADAARVLGRADAENSNRGERRLLADERALEELVARLQQALPASVLAELRAEGARLSNEQALSLAVSDGTTGC